VGFRSEEEAARQQIAALEASIARLEDDLAELRSREDARQAAIDDRVHALRSRTWPILLFGPIPVLLIALLAAAGLEDGDPDGDVVYAVVTEAEGGAVAPGDQCTMFLETQRGTNDAYNSRIHLLCGSRPLYDGGQLDCTLDARGRALRCEDAATSDSDEDPSIRFDRDARTLVLRDRGWSAHLEVEAPMVPSR